MSSYFVMSIEIYFILLVSEKGKGFSRLTVKIHPIVAI